MQRFNVSIEQTKGISEYTSGVLHKLSEESTRLQTHATQTSEDQMKSLNSFQKDYEGQSKSSAEKFMADMATLFYDHIRRQQELVDARLDGLKERSMANKTVLDIHVTSMEGITTDSKRKWQTFATQAENDAKDGVDYSAAKHSRMEELLQQNVNIADSNFKHCKSSWESVTEMGGKHAAALVSLPRNASESNEQHDAEIDSARAAAEQDVAKNSEDAIQLIDSVSE